MIFVTRSTTSSVTRVMTMTTMQGRRYGGMASLLPPSSPSARTIAALSPSSSAASTTSRPGCCCCSRGGCRAFRAGVPSTERVVVNVPTMGDSITEGTIVEWTKRIGQAVQPDDVVALVETDKVTVEIKAETAGVVTQQFGQVDETVEVGAKLYEIDTEAEATVTATDTDTDSASTAAAPSEEPISKTPQVEQQESPTVAAEQVVSSSASTHRTPSIQFLGKDGWAAMKSGQKTPPQQDTSTSAATTATSMGQIVANLNPMYGRTAFTEDEMDALIFGGANLEPQGTAAELDEVVG